MAHQGKTIDSALADANSRTLPALPSMPPLKKQRTDASDLSDSASPAPPASRWLYKTSEKPFKYRLRIRNAAQIVVIASQGERVKSGKSQGKVEIFPLAGLLVDHQGKIVAIDKEENLQKQYESSQNDEEMYHLYESEYDCTGYSLLPGLVDGHSHPVWAGDRVHEFSMKLAGIPYMKIHESGGGIGFTVRHTKQANEEELFSSLRHRLSRALQFGTTLLEAKSGYGLEWETEHHLLRVLTRASRDSSIPIDLVINYCAAHSIPPGKSAEETTKDIIEKQIPQLKQQLSNHHIETHLIDVFCEKGVFNVEQTESILKAGISIGLKGNFHGDEINSTGAAELSGKFSGLLAISHLEKISPLGIQRMAEHSIIGTLLPSTAHLLRLPAPPAREMINSGVPLALGSDYNPNAPYFSMPYAMYLACVEFRLTLEESLVAATLNAAASIGKEKSHGSIEPGKFGDFLVLETDKWEHLIYQWIDPPIKHVIKNGKCVYSKSEETSRGA